MAHKKQGGSTSLGRESESKRLGVKIYGGQIARAGQIIIRQRGSRFRPGPGVKQGADDTLYAAFTGLVSFSRKKVRRFTGAIKTASFVSVLKK